MINYIISVAFGEGDIEEAAQEESLRKIVKAIIRKMIKDERMLMVQEEGDGEDERLLRVHPNYTGAR